MPTVLDPQLKLALAERIRYYNELGIYDFYRRESTAQIQPEEREPLPRAKAAAVTPVVAGKEELFEISTKPESAFADPPRACAPSAKTSAIAPAAAWPSRAASRLFSVWAIHRAELMFIGEAPGADEDQQGEPFVGRSGQLLNNMIKAMGLRREDIYIANIIKCRPPGNRAPERDECETCSPFLMRQIATIKPKALVALGRLRPRRCWRSMRR